MNSTKKADARTRKHRAHWVHDQFVCRCGSRHFTIFREKVAHKIHTRTARRRRRVGICENDHKTRIGFPSRPRHK